METVFIKYTTDGGVLKFKNINFISHFYENGKGVIEIDANMDKLPDYAFSDCVNLLSIILPNTIRIIGYAAFKHCTNLSKIIFPSHLQQIESFAFSRCLNLVKVYLPKTTTYLGDMVFVECAKLRHMYIPNTIKKIGGYVVSKCVSLPSNQLNVINGEVTAYAFKKDFTFEPLIGGSYSLDKEILCKSEILDAIYVNSINVETFTPMYKVNITVPFTVDGLFGRNIFTNSPYFLKKMTKSELIDEFNQINH